MFRVIKLAENAGYGFDKIFNGWNTYVDDIPIYISSLDFVDLRMKTKKGIGLVEGLEEKLVEKLVEKYDLTQNQSKIISLMLDSNKISISKLSESIGISTTAIDKNISRLKDLEIVKRIGPDKGGYWEVIDVDDKGI